MNYGFVKVAAATPKIKVGDCLSNANEVVNLIKDSAKDNISLIVLPELCITGYTCSDLFLQDSLLEKAKEGLIKIVKETENLEILSVVGLPLLYNGILLNVAAVICKGEILGFVPKSYIPNYSEFYELRHFTSGRNIEDLIDVSEEFKDVPISCDLVFSCKNMPEFKLGVEICEDLWVPMPPSTNLALGGATVIANPSASDEVTGKDKYRRNLIMQQSARCLCGYVYADAGEGESSTDLVFAGHNIIAENGSLLKESKRFSMEMAVSYMDFNKIIAERRRIKSFADDFDAYDYIEFDLKFKDITDDFDRFVDPKPFVPQRDEERNERCEEILMIQAMGLKKRLEHTNCKQAVLGISGGLDSTLALLVTVKAFDLLNMPREQILAVTMPGFGTTDRTYNNAVEMIKSVGATFKEINIGEQVKRHLDEIGHDMSNKDITYENAQARYRTYLLMDLANEHNGMVIGTGDLSELALGWATYNGDHMSMYGVNSSVPKTLIRHLVRFYADTCDDDKLNRILLDVLDTPVSPELLPPDKGEIAQKTEDVVGPYELHDFFLYNVLRFGFVPEKVFFLAKHAFKDAFDEETILKWLKVFYRRFFSQQFKRSCLPDGPKVGSVAISPRGDLRMPSDAVSREWLLRLEELG